MDERFEKILTTVEPFPDSIYGPRYRCSLILRDGTVVPCAVLQSKAKLVELAKRRIQEEMTGKGVFRNHPDPFGQIVSSFAVKANGVNEYDVVSTTYSTYAPPLALLKQIHGETTMSWTGWVFEMMDGKMYSYGSSFSMEFFDLPNGYSFADVVKVHNHSFVSSGGHLAPLTPGAILPANYRELKLLRERVYFTCYIDGI